ncbi:MAG: glycoside hydrolase family 2 [Lachnospiraceae bacterium]|nr:glycoside hydrolase family 2 [Lachnospiraceae bacterium]
MSRLQTIYEQNMREQDSNPWDIYPRPLMQRESFISLNGTWQLFLLEARKKGRTLCRSERLVGDIRVPFPPESPISGIEQTLKKGQHWIYRKSIISPRLQEGEKLILHFGAVDQVCHVRLNGCPVGGHEGGYLPFEMDLTAALKEGENLLEVEAEDDHLPEYGLGKQSLKRGGMWYTAHSGIWQSVWMEVLPENGFRSVETYADGAHVTVRVTGAKGMKKLTIDGQTYAFSGESLSVHLEKPHWWTTEDPYLYRFSLENKTDKVESYFALRTVDIRRISVSDAEAGGTGRQEQAYICLNGKPIFLHGLLDQGYYPDGIVLPASPKAYGDDIAAMKRLGFNFLRKHIKIEPQVFYYECDRQGMLVMQDLVNSGRYFFLADTVLPTLGLQRLITHRATMERKARFEADAGKTLELVKGHPSVFSVTIFNEGWGQYDTDRLYKKLKEEAPEMIFDSASGWFKGHLTDVASDHVYFKRVRMQRTPKKPMLLSEYGGYALQTPGHVFNEDKVYGYKRFGTGEELQEGLEKLFEADVIPAIRRGLNGAVLTQLSDVEDETNGMLTYDRKVLKVDEDRMQKAAQRLQEVFRETVGC